MGNLCNKKADDAIKNTNRESSLDRESNFVSSPISTSPTYNTNVSVSKPTVSSEIPLTSRKSGPLTEVPFSNSKTLEQSNDNASFSSSRKSGPLTEVPFSNSRTSGAITEVPFSESSLNEKHDQEVKSTSFDSTLPPPPPSRPLKRFSTVPNISPPTDGSQPAPPPPPPIPTKRPSLDDPSPPPPPIPTKRPSINPSINPPVVTTVEKIKLLKENLLKDESISKETFNSYFELAMSYQDLNDNENTIDCYKKCLDMTTKLFKQEENEFFDISFRLGVTLYKIQNYEESRFHLANVIENNDKLDKDNKLVLLSYYYLGLLNKDLKYIDEATELLFLCYTGLKSSQPNSIDFLNCAYELADIYSNIDLDQGIIFIMEATVGRTEILGDEHIDTIHSKELYGRILMNKEEYEKSSIIMRNVINQYNSILGPKDVVTLKAKFSLALCLQFLGELDEAIVYFEESSDAFEQIYGVNNEFTADSKFKLAIALSAHGDMIEAEKLYRCCIDIYKVLEGEDSHNSYVSHYYLGLLLFQSGNKLEEGKFHLKKGIENLIEVFGKDSEEVLEAYDLLNSEGVK